MCSNTHITGITTEVSWNNKTEQLFKHIINFSWNKKENKILWEKDTLSAGRSVNKTYSTQVTGIQS